MNATNKFNSVGGSVALNMHSCQDHTHIADVQVSVVLYLDKVHCRRKAISSESRTDLYCQCTLLYCLTAPPMAL